MDKNRRRGRRLQYAIRRLSAGSTCYIVGSGNGPAEILSSHDGQVWSKLVLEDYGWLRGITGSPDGW